MPDLSELFFNPNIAALPKYNSGLTLITYLYEMAFRSGDLGLGAAVGWVVTLIIFAISIVQLRVSRILAQSKEPR